LSGPAVVRVGHSCPTRRSSDLPQVERQLTDATWKAVAFYESLISIADPDVQAYILYFPAGAPARANLEVEYRPSSGRNSPKDKHPLKCRREPCAQPAAGLTDPDDTP